MGVNSLGSPGNFHVKNKTNQLFTASFLCLPKRTAFTVWVTSAATLFVFHLLFAVTCCETTIWAGEHWAHSMPATSNPIATENRKRGSSDWALTNPALNREVEGFMSHTSVHRGESILLFHNSKSPMVELEVFRTGWYQGLGARRLFGPVQVAGVEQVVPSPDNYGMVQCQWKDPFILHTNNTWTTGVYLVRLTESSTFAQSYTIFVLRDDSHIADITFQLPTNTYQAYNFWGGRSLYGWGSGSQLPWGTRGGTKARKVSYDRPYARSNNERAAHGNGAGEYLTNIQPLFPNYGLNSSASWNYNMVRWLEREEVDVTYITNVDTHDRMRDLPRPKLFLTQGHDEYWSNEMRDNVEGLRDNGTHLAFLGSNTAYFMVRMEEGEGNPNIIDPVLAPKLARNESRVITCYKQGRKDPIKDKRSVPAREYRPEADMVGVEYVGDPYEEDMVIKNASHWMFNGTGVLDGHVLPGLLGYEVDSMRDSKTKNNNIITPIFETPLKNIHIMRSDPILLCHGTIYTAESGAHVLGSGTMQWSWALDDYGVMEGLRSSRLNNVIERVTWNFFEAAGIMRTHSY